MTRFVLIAAAGIGLFGSATAEAAPKAKAPFPMAADGTTNIADCAKADAKFRDSCISRSRPVTGKQIYAQNPVVAPKAKVAVAAKAEKAAKAAVKAPVPAAVVGAPKGFKIAKDGTTNVADCAKAAPAVRDSCISRARPMTGKELAKYIKQRAGETPNVETKAPVPKAAPKKASDAAPAKAAPVAVAAVKGKGFAIAKDGTTNIADCGKANPEFRNECISRARPVTGAEIYGAAKSAKTKS